MRILIADDEPLSRLRIRALLETAPDVLVAGEAQDGIAAEALIRDLRPDAVFLDIQMPGASGLDVIDGLAPAERPLTVFLTAFDQFAVRAFEAEAVDYLLKPFDDVRFAGMLERLRKRLAARPGAQLSARSRGRLTRIDLAAIDWLAAAGDYVEVHAEGRTHLLDETLAGLSTRLPAGAFARIHRSTLVRLDRVRALESAGHGDGVVVLSSGERLRLSRRYRAAFLAALSSSTSA
ncbi:LytR/AlgR family response regulator transcription factor [Caulobacter segnis]|uniref:LytR/AlgR family response regulator transcription factor n=1 Tax=Caulobacter segnis TaxID=88688 RepID=UPI001CBDE437|nr:LytTR family DNA-binding domain-containing protein [Caulobacter segnis]UAL09258.1 LytTR family DNA-binding domain-containing protein [Caulobacter segnis]